MDSCKALSKVRPASMDTKDQSRRGSALWLPLWLLFHLFGPHFLRSKAGLFLMRCKKCFGWKAWNFGWHSIFLELKTQLFVKDSMICSCPQKTSDTKCVGFFLTPPSNQHSTLQTPTGCLAICCMSNTIYLNLASDPTS